ncbi:lipid kinase [Desulfosarcina alkanivorans]|jgi:YegS/Rv2252/BmrU family lipid kinase|uniref:Lipid kinase n=1 Tax=Desulfosarcina alkanivorans TaxID=571177 RepID=A0A5K7YSE6_9BACT|nr:diacylglycerol kinase family protein [Desulfosarcina alkanivorans]BBO69901.1 lipid kinase [Desulfosarcina alkanivorans]
MTLALIANPSAGGRKGARVIPQVEKRLRLYGLDYRIFITQQHAHALDIARRLTPANYDGIVSIGGDGTNFHLLNGLLKYHDPDRLPPLGIIPVGSGNSFARDLNIRTTKDGLRALIRGRTRPVDVCSFDRGGQPWYFVNLAGFGFVTDVAQTAHHLKRVGDFSYVMGVFHRMLNLRFHHMELEIDGRRINGDNCFVEFCNSRYTGGKMLMAPHAKIDDGWFDVVVAGPISRGALMATFPKIFSGTHGQHPAVRFYRARTASVRTDPPKPLLPDGELFGSTPTRVAIHPQWVRYFS